MKLLKIKQGCATLCFLFIKISFCLLFFNSQSCLAINSEAIIIKSASEKDFPPYAIVSKQGLATGFSVELLQAVVKAVDVQIKITPGGWNFIWEQLVSGQIDVLPIVAQSAERRKLIDFSLPYTETFDSFFIREGSSVIHNIAEAQGKKIIVMKHDAAHQELINRKFQGDILTVDTLVEGLKILASGKYDALLCSKIIGVLLINENHIKGVMAGSIISDYKRVFSFGIKKDAVELREKLDQGLLIVKTNGEYERIYQKWLGFDDPWRNYNTYFPYIISVVIIIIFISFFAWFVLLKRAIKKRTIELTNSKKQLSMALGLNDAGVWEWNIGTNTVRFDEQFHKMLGYDFGELPTTMSEWLTYHHPDDLPVMMSKAKAYLQGEVSVYESEHRIRNKAGTWSWVFTRGRRETVINSGSAELFIGVAMDITKRKLDEAQFFETKEYLENLFNYANVPIIVWNNNLEIIRFNYAFEQLSGYAAVEVIARKIDILFPQNNLTNSLKLINKTTAGEKWKTVEIEILTKNKAVKTVLWNSANIIDNNNQKVLATIAQGQDITERKHFEVEMLQAKEQAERANLSKSQFLANMSHEIRTPMNGVIGMGELLSFTKLDENQIKMLDAIITSANNLLTIINDILDISKIEAGKTNIEIEEFNIENTIKECVLVVAHNANKKNIKVVAAIDKEVPIYLQGDVGKIKQILLNLIFNAVKFTDNGSILIEVKKQTEQADAVELEFSVLDSGIGITNEVQINLFQPFVQ